MVTTIDCAYVRSLVLVHVLTGCVKDYLYRQIFCEGEGRDRISEIRVPHFPVASPSEGKITAFNVFADHLALAVTPTLICPLAS